MQHSRQDATDMQRAACDVWNATCDVWNGNMPLMARRQPAALHAVRHCTVQQSSKVHARVQRHRSCVGTAACCTLPVASDVVHVASDMLHVASGVVHAACCIQYGACCMLHDVCPRCTLSMAWQRAPCKVQHQPAAFCLPGACCLLRVVVCT
jgi:hypothetical protein